MSVRLFVLGLAIGGGIHGYEIKDTARRWGVERWAKLGIGSIYHALGKLQEEGLLVEEGVHQEGNRPPRTVYRLTQSGRAAFFALLRETCRTADPETREIDMALAFIHHLPPSERVSLLTERLHGLQPRFEALTASMTAFDADTDPEVRQLNRAVPWVSHGVRHSLGRVAFECDWLRTVIASVADWPSATPPREDPE
jgi:DNA-binding PadR family transcriptional regulator